MSELEATLKRLSHEFADALIAAFRKLPVETLYEDVQLDAAPARARGPARGPAPARARGPAPARARGRGARAAAGGPSETEVSILEHLNEAGPTGSTVRAWVISTQGELPAHEHDQLERDAHAVLDALEAKGLIQKRAFSKSRGQVYALAPV